MVLVGQQPILIGLDGDWFDGLEVKRLFFKLQKTLSQALLGDSLLAFEAFASGL